MKIKKIPKEILIYAFIYNNKNCYLLEISKKLNITYSYAQNIMKYAQKKKILTVEKIGRKNKINFTFDFLPFGKICNDFLIEANKIKGDKN